ncbi:hypothetical protein [Natrarchaeobius oligotrophus]|uniref:Uncharacterized protein n=1 Tax=Natrarchaeobius chitinivorans TaxID=1679083 RepID=A0A3N6MDI9_NATCH|nr:hypothetical protein [Natrarchaeobius chitinivorans]RQH00828.1 hypothetical protein EA472_09335 [Natrarchaeobius chitinivorans]
MVSRRQLLAAGTLVVGTAGCLDALDTSRADGSDADGQRSDGAAGGPNGGDATDDASRRLDPDAPDDPDAPLVTIVEEDGDDELTLATYGDVDEIGSPAFDERRGTHYVPLVFAESAADDFVATLESVGALESPAERELVTYAGDDPIGTYGIGESLANAMREGEWDGSFRIVAENEEELEAFVAEFEADWDRLS